MPEFNVDEITYPCPYPYVSLAYHLLKEPTGGQYIK